jgi:acyl-CoA thioester hydrolase
MSGYTFETSFDPRYPDLDVNGHVNQAVYLSYLEQARTKYWEEVIGIRHDRTPVAVVRQEIEYEAPIRIDQEVTVAQRIVDLGRTSMEIEYEVRADGTVAATAEVVLLALDRGSQEAIPIPPEWREPIADHEGLEES